MELVFRNVFGVTDLPPGTLLLEREKMKTFDYRLNDSWWALRVALRVMPIVSGVDKYFNKLTDCGMYLSPDATKMIPVSTATFYALGRYCGD
jgi:hypothetical protein